MASRPTRGRPSGARSPHRRPRSEAEALVTGVFGQWLAVRSVSRPCQCFHIALAAAPAGLTVRLAMSPPVSPPNERSEGGAGAFRGKATTPRLFDVVCPHCPSGGRRAGGVGGGLTGRGSGLLAARVAGVFITGWQPPLRARHVVTRFVHCPTTLPPPAVAFATPLACATSLNGCGTPKRAPVPLVCSHRAAKVSP